MSAIEIMKKIILIFICSFWCSTTFAGSCTSVTPQTSTINFGNIWVQRDAAVGTVLFSGTPSRTGYYTSGCTNPLTLGFTMLYSSGGVSSYGDGVYNTNLAGVGIKVTAGSYIFSNPTFSTLYNASSSQVDWSGGNVKLIKTGDITPGVLNTGDIGKISVVLNDDAYHDGLTITTSGGSVALMACSITTQSINVPLEDVMAANLTAIGNTAKPKEFNVGLTCDAGTRVNAMLTGVQNTDTSTAGVLQLTGAGSAEVASGVGIQILYNNTPLALNNNIVLKTSAGGQETFPFTAQYYQTKNTVKTGSANAIATLNITYQ